MLELGKGHFCKYSSADLLPPHEHLSASHASCCKFNLPTVTRADFGGQCTAQLEQASALLTASICILAFRSLPSLSMARPCARRAMSASAGRVACCGLCLRLATCTIAEIPFAHLLPPCKHPSASHAFCFKDKLLTVTKTDFGWCQMYTACRTSICLVDRLTCV